MNNLQIHFLTLMNIECQIYSQGKSNEVTDHHLIAEINLPGRDTIDLLAIFSCNKEGNTSAELLKIFPEMLATELDKVINVHSAIEITDALYDAIMNVDYKLYQGGGFHDLCSVVVVLWTRGDPLLYLANVGDTKAIVYDDSSLIKETRTHISSEGELTRCIGGDEYKLIDGVYAGKRAEVSPEPDIICIDITHPIRVILASDGVWSALDNQTIIDTIDCQKLIDKAVRTGSTKNITIIKGYFNK